MTAYNCPNCGESDDRYILHKDERARWCVICRHEWMPLYNDALIARAYEETQRMQNERAADAARGVL